MADDIQTAAPVSKAPPMSVAGLTKPFTGKDDLAKDGVDEETGLFHGVHPDTKERVSVTLEGLKAEFGDELGEKKYLAIAGIGGGSVFFQPMAEATSFRPPLGISGLNAERAAEVAQILASKE